jgi:hypothetical protein
LKNKLAKQKENFGISFSPSVQVMPIPRIKDYPRATRKMMWGSRLGRYVLDVNDDEDNDEDNNKDNNGDNNGDNN